MIPSESALLRYTRSGVDVDDIVAALQDGRIDESGLFVFETVPICNARDLNDPASLDREGFVLLEHQTSVKDFDDSYQISRIYTSELETLVSRATGAKRAAVFEHTRRSSLVVDPRSPGKLGSPVRFVHNDFSSNTAVRAIREHFEGDPKTAEALASKRFAIITIWRSTSGVVRGFPLAVCDATSVSDGDIIHIKRLGKGMRTHENFLAKFNPKHKWFYFPEMTMDEALLFKCYDSAIGDVSRMTLHSAFEEPNASQVPSVRHSIESRCLAFYD